MIKDSTQKLLRLLSRVSVEDMAEILFCKQPHLIPLPVDIYKSEGTRFVVENGAIRPPFNAIPGVGDTAALAIAQKRGTEPFRSVEEFAARTGANSGVIAALEGCGCFEGLPQSDQISLFDF